MSSSVARFLSALALFASVPAFAHHSYAMFEMQKDVTVEGTVQQFQWTNPHIWIDIVATDKNTGQAVKWSIEGSAPTVLRGYGWKQDSVKAGDKVTLVIHPLKSGNNGGTLAKIAVNGKDLPTK
jgi:hypothetical protein